MEARGLKLQKAAVMVRLLRILFWGPAVIYLIVCVLVLGPARFWEGFTGISLGWFVLLAVTFVVHEALHAIGLWAAGARPQSIRFKVDKANLSIECCCSDPVSLKGFRISALLPFVVLTPVLLGLALAVEAFGAWMMLIISVSACAYDLTITIAMSNMPSDTKVIPELHVSEGSVFIRLADA
jgi:hypothetical protein